MSFLHGYRSVRHDILNKPIVYNAPDPSRRPLLLSSSPVTCHILRSPPLLAPVLRGCSCCPRLSLTSCRLSVVSLTSLPPGTLHYSCFRYTTPPLCRHSPVIGRASDQMWNRTGGDDEIWRFVDCGKERVIN